MRRVTLCFPVRDNRVLLARKKVRFGAGKWNGFGGRIEGRETPHEAACRELHEECRLAARGEWLEQRGLLRFFFEGEPHKNHEVHVFLAHLWEGEPVPTDEMDEPHWFAIDAMPLDEMWEADRYWIPRLLQGEVLEGDITFRTAGGVNHIQEKNFWPCTF